MSKHNDTTRSVGDRIAGLAHSQHGFISARQARAAGIHSQEITRLVAAGVLERVAPGHYRLVDHPVTEHHALAVAARAAPHGVVCLLSALNVHEIGSQLPAEVWIAVERGARAPRGLYVPFRIVRLSGPAFTSGIEVHPIEGYPVPVYSVAKTLADLFKHRSSVGIDVAVTALKEAWRDQKFTMDDLDHAARACRVERVIRPYVEAIVS